MKKKNKFFLNFIGRKAQFNFARKTIYWTIAGVIITMVVFAYVLILSSYAGRLTFVPNQLRGELISLRFTNTAECFAYQDTVTGRVYPGTIDLAKFSEERLNNCYFTDPQKGYEDYNFELVLQNLDQKLATNKYYHKVSFTIFKEILVKKEDGFENEHLIIYVQEEI